MVTRALTRAFRVPRNPVCHRCSSTTSRQSTQSTPRSPKPSGQTPRFDGPKPRSDNQRPRFDDPKPRSDNQRPRFDGRKPRSDNQKPRFDGPKPKPDSSRPRTDGQKPKPDGQRPRFGNPTPKPAVQRPIFDNPTPKPAERPRFDNPTPKPAVQRPRFDNPTPKPAERPRFDNPTPPSRPFNTSRGPGIIPIVTRWAHQHNVGFPTELKGAKLKSAGASIQFKHSPRHVFRPYHVPQFFSGFHQHVLVEYWLYKYGEKRVEPLWVHITGSYQVKPIVRNFARRRVRQGLFAALAERGYTPDGRVAEAGSQGGESGGKTGRRAPGPGMKGTISLHVADPVAIMNLEREMYLEIGREIVKSVVPQQSAR